MRGVVDKQKKVSLQELISSQKIILYAYQKVNKLKNDADNADKGEEWEKDGDAGMEEPQEIQQQLED